MSARLLSSHVNEKWKGEVPSRNCYGQPTYGFPAAETGDDGLGAFVML